MTDRVTEIPGLELWSFDTSFPQDQRQVRWFAFGGQATTTVPGPADWVQLGVLTLTALYQPDPNNPSSLLYLAYTTYSAAAFANSSDLVVPIASQFKGLPQAANTQLYYRHTHSAPLAGYNETSSPYMRADVRKLLSAYADGITLSGLDDGGTISDTAADRAFLPLTTAP